MFFLSVVFFFRFISTLVSARRRFLFAKMIAFSVKHIIVSRRRLHCRFLQTRTFSTIRFRLIFSYYFKRTARERLINICKQIFFSYFYYTRHINTFITLYNSIITRATAQSPHTRACAVIIIIIIITCFATLKTRILHSTNVSPAAVVYV